MKFFRLFLLYLNYFFNSSLLPLLWIAVDTFEYFPNRLTSSSSLPPSPSSSSSAEQENITRKSYANILFAFFTWYLTCYRRFSLFFFCPFLPPSQDWKTHEEFMALWARVFFFWEGWVCVCERGSLSTAAILMNSIDWTEPRVLFYTLNNNTTQTPCHIPSRRSTKVSSTKTGAGWVENSLVKIDKWKSCRAKKFT